MLQKECEMPGTYAQYKSAQRHYDNMNDDPSPEDEFEERFSESHPCACGECDWNRFDPHEPYDCICDKCGTGPDGELEEEEDDDDE